MLPVEESLLLSSDELLSKEEFCELSIETLLSVELSTEESLSLVEAWIEFSELLAKTLLSVESSTEEELVLVEESIEVVELLAERLLSFEDELPSTVKLQAASAVMERVAATAHNKVISFLTFLIINSF